MGIADIDEIDELPQAKRVVSPQSLSTTGGPITGGGNAFGTVDLADLFGGPVVSTNMSAMASHVGGAHAGTNAQHVESAEVCHLNAAPFSIPVCDEKEQEKSVTGQTNDFLDTFFTPPPFTESSVQCNAQEEVKVADLLDFSKTVQAKCSDAHSLLEAFENQSKGHHVVTRNGFLLADLSKGVSSNLVKARLLKLMNYYDLLGVSRNATLKEIRQHYKMKTLELHPDRAGHDQSPEEAELFRMVTTAHDILTDPEKRAKYDEELRRTEEEVDNRSSWFDHLGRK